MPQSVDPKDDLVREWLKASRESRNRARTEVGKEAGMSEEEAQALSRDNATTLDKNFTRIQVAALYIVCIPLACVGSWLIVFLLFKFGVNVANGPEAELRELMLGFFTYLGGVATPFVLRAFGGKKDT